MHLPQQRRACTDCAHDGKLTRPLFTRCRHSGKQHHQPGCQGEAEQKLNGANHLVEHALNLDQGAARVDVGDVGKSADQVIVKAELALPGAGRQRQGCAKSTDVAQRHVSEFADRVNHKKVHAHGSPVHFTHAGDACFAEYASNVKAQCVTQLQAQRVSQTLLNAECISFFGCPAAVQHLVVVRQRSSIGDIELTVHQPLRTRVCIIFGLDRLAIDGHQTAANHGVPVKAAHAGLPQCLLKGFTLLGLHVDDETVRRIRRCGLTPTADEVGAQQNQKHQGQQAHCQRTDLHHCKSRPRRQLPRGQHQPARRRSLVDAGTQQTQRTITGQRKQQYRSGKSAHGDQPEFDIAAGGQQQDGKTQHAHQKHRHGRRLEFADIAAYHAQRRHLRQLQHRRQAESEQQSQAHAHAKSHRPERRGRQRRLDQTGQ